MKERRPCSAGVFRRRCVALVVMLVSSGSPTAADVAAGRKKAGACVACHGDAGIATLPNAPHLAGQPALYLTEQMRQFRSGKRPSEVMAVIAKSLSDQDIDDLAAWYEAIAIDAKPPR